MRRYADITDKTSKERILQRKKQTLYLYSAIVRDVGEILKILLPSDKAMVVGEHIKSIMRSVIYLATGKQPDNF